MECDGSDLGLLHDVSDGPEVKSGLGLDVGCVDKNFGVEKMDSEEKNTASKKRVMESEAEFDLDDDEPIGSRYKLKSRKNSKKAKMDLDGGCIMDKQVELGVDKLMVKDEDLGGMNDTLASFKKKLKGPKKYTGSVLTAARGLDTNVADPSGPSTNGPVNDEVLAAELISKLEEKGQMTGDQQSGGGSTECMEEKFEDCLSAFFKKAQLGSNSKSRRSMRSKLVACDQNKVGKCQNIDDTVSQVSNCIWQNQSSSPKEFLCVEVKDNYSLPMREPILGNESFKNDSNNSSIRKACDLGHNNVADVPNSISAPEQKQNVNQSAENLDQQFTGVARNATSSTDQKVCSIFEKDVNGPYLGNGLSNRLCEEDTSNETIKLISGPNRAQSETSPSAFVSGQKEVICSDCIRPNQVPGISVFASISSQKEEVSASDRRLSPVSPNAVHKQEISCQAIHLENSQETFDNPGSLTQNQNQASDDVGKGVPILSCDSSGDEAGGSSSPSTMQDYNGSYADDIGSGHSSKSKENKLSDGQRAVRESRKRRQWDMTYEGDADWDSMIHEKNFLVCNQAEDDNQLMRKEKLNSSLSVFPEAENGAAAAVSVGLKARRAGPVEKIKFREVLKRKGGLQEYLECRNHILGVWNKDVSRILRLSDCGVSDTPVVDELPRDSLIRDIYAFLDYSGYINIGVASGKQTTETASKYKQLLKEEEVEEKSVPPPSGSDDGVSFILGRCKNFETSMVKKNFGEYDDENRATRSERDGLLLDPQALEFSIPLEPEGFDDYQGIGATSVITSELTKNSCGVLSSAVDQKVVSQQVPSDSEVKKRIIVIGAGPAGLAAARHLQRQGFHVTVLEARGRIGGRVFTDRTSLSVPVDLGASIITGVEADVDTERRAEPSALICNQLGLEMTVLNSDCPLYDTVTGRKVPAELDEALEEEYNSLLDDMVLLVAQKGEHAMRMSLEDGLEYALQKRRIVRSRKNYLESDVHILGSQNSKAGILSPLERRVMDWHFAHLEYGCAALLKEVSLPYWNQDDVYGGFGGAHCMIKGGYSNVVESLGEGLCVHLNHVVTNITYRTKDLVTNADDQHDRVKVSTSNGRDFLGDAVLITVPLGCLKVGSIKFAPPLPQWKNLSIQRLGFGVLNKVVLEFSEVFWDDSVDYFGATAEETNARGHCFMFWNVKKTVGAPVLIALVVGKAALEEQNMSSSDRVSHALVVLRKLFGPAVVPDPVASVVTDWGRDPYSYGAYSYVAMGASGEDYDILGMPVDNCLFFAGEATCKEYPDTVGGAMMSGLREAVRIMNILSTGSDCTAEMNAMEAEQRRHTDSERNELRDIMKRLSAVEVSNAMYKKSLDGTRIMTREALLKDMFSKAITTAGRLYLVKELLKLPVGVLKSFAGTKQGLSTLNSWVLDSMGKDGTQLLRHCVRLLVLVSTDLLAVRLSGIGKTVKEKVCVHTSRDIRAIASQLVNVWVEIFRKEKASNSGLKLRRQQGAVDSLKSKYNNLAFGKPPLRTHHGAPDESKKGNTKLVKLEVKALMSQGSVGRHDSKEEEDKDYALSEEEKAAISAAEAARAAAIKAAEAYAALDPSRCNNTSLQLPKIPSFQKFARREQYTQMDESDVRRKWSAGSGGVVGRQDCISEDIDTRNCKVRDWTVDFSAAAYANLEISSKMSVDNHSHRSHHSNEQLMNFREERSGESVVAAADNDIFTRAWVDGAGSDGIKDSSAIDRWQSQAANADSEFYNRTVHAMMGEEDLLNKNQPMQANESYAASHVTINRELVKSQPRGTENIKQAVVDYVASLLMPLYKARKIDKDGYKAIMKKTATKVMEQTTDAEKLMAVSEFLDSKRKNKIRAFVDTLIERHMTQSRGGIS